MNADEVRIDIPIGRAGYDLFIGCKRLATYRVQGRTVITDATSYAAVFGGHIDTRSHSTYN